MGENTKIEWATHTLNFWEGCTKVSEGCAHCYAEARNARFGGGTAPNWGPGAPRRLTSVSNWMQAEKWNREAEASGVRPRVFVNSLSDIFDAEVSVEWRAKAFELMHRTPCVDYLLVTKRPQLWAKLMLEVALYLAGFRDGSENPVAPQSPAWEWVHEWISTQTAPDNIWIGTTVENQARADERLPELIEIPARVRFLSVEPLLGRVDLSYWLTASIVPQVQWVIVGGESGRGARPMHPDWAREIRDECFAAGVPFFFKQWGEWLPDNQRAWTVELGKHEFGILNLDGTRLNHRCGYTPPAVGLVRVGKAAAGRKLDGVEHNALPEVRR